MLKLAVVSSISKIDDETLSNGRRPSRTRIAEPDIDFVTLASMTEGYSASDLIDLVGSATQQAIIRSARSGDNHVRFLILHSVRTGIIS